MNFSRAEKLVMRGFCTAGTSSVVENQLFENGASKAGEVAVIKQEIAVRVICSIIDANFERRCIGSWGTYENLVLLHSSVPQRPSGIIVPIISTTIH